MRVILLVVWSHFEDITQRKIAENDLQESEEKFRSLVENLNVGVYRNTVDRGGHFIQVNPAFARIFGYESTSEIMETRVVDFFPDPSQRLSFLEDLKNEGSIIDRELHLKKKDNTHIWVSVSAQATIQ